MTHSHEHNHEYDERCKALFARISDYLDGDVEPAVASEIESRVQECPECAECLRVMRATRGWIRNDPDCEPRPELREQMRVKLLECIDAWDGEESSD